MNEKNYMSKWELACIVFNSLVYKLLTHYPGKYVEFGGSAAWITAFFTGAVFLVGLYFVLRFYEPISDIGLSGYLKSMKKDKLNTCLLIFLILYFVFGLCYAQTAACNALKAVAYVNSPKWFVILFYALCSVMLCIFGEKAVRRIHSLNAAAVGIAILSIAVMGFKYADGFNLTPVLGKGAASVFGKGLMTLFMYSDILVIFLLPKKGGKYSFKKAVMGAAAAAVIVNVIITLAISLNTPPELGEKFSLPIYPLTKTAGIGKLPARLDAVYQAALIGSTLMYTSLALKLALSCISSVTGRAKRMMASLVCLGLCMSLCGCYDSREVEEKAYVIALGVDLGESEKYRYTFQISNPLESGGSIGAEEKASENSSEKASEKEGNKTVDNVVVEADDYYGAYDKLKGHISKEPDLSHIKLIVYSYDVAREGGMEHSELLINEREVRPGTNMCISESAEKFLFSVKPTLEENTVRYYELFFDNRNVPYASVTELRNFVGRSLDKGFDAVVPIARENTLEGMGVFSDGELKALMSAEDVVVYKVLRGELKKTSTACETLIESDGRTDISVDTSGDVPEIEITVYVKISGERAFETEMLLENKAERFLYRTATLDCDVTGIKRYLKKNCLTQDEWERKEIDKMLKKARFSVRVFTENVKNIQNLQK